LGILVEDDVVKHIPEGYIMTVEFCEAPEMGMASSSEKSSAVEVKPPF
jgi:hypothetical protein